MQWVSFDSQEAEFSIEMPSQPSPTTTTSSFIGDVTNRLFISADGNQRFVVDYSRIPRFAFDFASVRFP